MLDEQILILYFFELSTDINRCACHTRYILKFWQFLLITYLCYCKQKEQWGIYHEYALWHFAYRLNEEDVVVLSFFFNKGFATQGRIVRVNLKTSQFLHYFIVARSICINIFVAHCISQLIIGGETTKFTKFQSIQ